MLAHRTHIDVEKPSHQFLRQPDRFVLIAHFQGIPAGLGGENQEFGGGIADVLFAGHGKYVRKNSIQIPRKRKTRLFGSPDPHVERCVMLRINSKANPVFVPPTEYPDHQ